MGAFIDVVYVTVGASYVKCCSMCVPTMELIESVPLRSDVYPAAARQLMAVVVVHVTVAHTVTPICILGVKSDMPKLFPYTEIVAPELVGVFSGTACELAGAS